MTTTLGANQLQESTYELIRLLLSISVKAHREGLLALDDYQTNNIYLKTMIKLAVDQVDQKVSQRILDNLVVSTKAEELERVHLKLINETYFSLHERMQPSVLRMLLLSHLGVNCIELKIADYEGLLDYETHPLKKYDSKKIREIFGKKHRYSPEDDGTIIKKEILALDDRSIEKVIRELQTFVIAQNLYGASDDLINAYLRNMSAWNANTMIEWMLYHAPFTDQQLDGQNAFTSFIINNLKDHRELSYRGEKND